LFGHTARMEICCSIIVCGKLHIVRYRYSQMSTNVVFSTWNPPPVPQMRQYRTLKRGVSTEAWKPEWNFCPGQFPPFPSETGTRGFKNLKKKTDNLYNPFTNVSNHLMRRQRHTHQGEDYDAMPAQGLSSQIHHHLG
jgi:hypothetical protein